MLTVLGGLAEFERELIRTRTGEGCERAKARGVILGRKPKLTSHQRREAIARREAGEGLKEISRSYKVMPNTNNRLSLRDDKRNAETEFRQCKQEKDMPVRRAL